MEQELAYSFHLGSDKNKSKLAKKVSKENVSGTTSLSNNAVQNANDLSRVNRHNLRDYDNQKELIRVIHGTNNIVNDVQDLYLQEFEETRIEYNNKQTRNDRKIDNYFVKVCNSQNDIACEIIVELGDMDFWNDKEKEYRIKMIDVYNEQIKDLIRIVLTFKIANATIHFDETSPHMHIVGVPIIENLKPTPFNKNNKVISNEDIEIIRNYTKEVNTTTKTIRSVNDLNMAIKEFEYSSFEIAKENSSLKYQLETKDDEINNLKGKLSNKEKIISKLQTEKEKLKQELQKFKAFWHSIMGHFHKRICYDKDKNYKIVSDDLYKNGVFTDDDNEIVNNIYRKVKPKEDIEQTKKKDYNMELK